MYVSDPVTLNYLFADMNLVEQSSFIVEYGISHLDRSGELNTECIRRTYRLLLGPGLMSSVGERHRRQRKTLNPVFSARNLKEMLPVFYGVIYKVCFSTLFLFSSRTES